MNEPWRLKQKAKGVLFSVGLAAGVVIVCGTAIYVATRIVRWAWLGV